MEVVIGVMYLLTLEKLPHQSDASTILSGNYQKLRRRDEGFFPTVFRNIMALQTP